MVRNEPNDLRRLTALSAIIYALLSVVKSKSILQVLLNPNQLLLMRKFCMVQFTATSSFNVGVICQNKETELLFGTGGHPIRAHL